MPRSTEAITTRTLQKGANVTALLSLEPRVAGEDVVELSIEMPLNAHDYRCGAGATHTYKCFDDTCL